MKCKMDDFLTSGKVARMFGVSVGTVIKWCNKGLLPCVRFPGSSNRRIKFSDVEDFAADYDFPLNKSETESETESEKEKS